MQSCDVAKSWIRKMDVAERYGFLSCTFHKELAYSSVRADYFSNKLYLTGCQEEWGKYKEHESSFQMH